ncbi:MAG: hypothetical protein IKY02_01295 [Lachnospiraceae bacterium]|nr:hypothetical protein [Lachnospiraceae bacterium]
MKFSFFRFLGILLLVFAVLFASCQQTDQTKESDPVETAAPGKYQLNANGEAIVNDVDFTNRKDVNDANLVFYEIFVGSFSDSNGDGIGDLRGIINRFDYLNDGNPESGTSLGVEGIWLTPIFTSSSYHKYNVNNYYEVDPSFGTMEDLKELIALCHERGVKLILDLVINHTGTRNEWYQNFIVAQRALDEKDPYFDFYSYYVGGTSAPAGRTFSQLSGTNVYYECNFSGDMPELNFDNELVREKVLEVAKYYLDLGIDGFRFDAAKYIYYTDHEKSVDFWKWYIGELKKIKSDVYTVAEVWDGDTITDKYYPALNCFDFTVSQASGLIATAAKGGSAGQYTSYVENYLKTVRALRADATIVPFVTNHDMDRAAGFLVETNGQAKIGANLYLLGPGSPFIYYGEELGMRGSRGGAATDANRRLAMVWGDGDTVADPTGSTYKASNQTTETMVKQIGRDSSLFTYYKRLIMIRKANPEIARGDYQALTFNDLKLGGFTSTYDGKTVAVLHNTTASAITIDLSTIPALSGMKLREFIGEGEAVLNGTSLTIEGKTSVVLR